MTKKDDFEESDFRDEKPYDDNIEDQILERLKGDPSRAKLFEKIITPDLKDAKDLNLAGTITPFTKELKVSNLDARQMNLINEMSDLACQWANAGAMGIAKNLIRFRDVMLSLAPSKQGMLLRLMNSEYQIKEIKRTKPARRLFRSSEPEQD